MSYDINIVDRNGDVIYVDEPHRIAGGTYSPDSTELWLNITFNYGKIFSRDDVFGTGGIKNLIGMTVKDALPVVTKAVSVLKDDYDDDYWAATEGNAKRSLMNLIKILNLAPADGIIAIGY